MISRESIVASEHKESICVIYLERKNQGSLDNGVVSRLRGTRKARKKYVENQFDYVFIAEVKRIYRDFLNNHGSTIDNVVFEIDADLRKSFSHLGLTNKDPDYVHDIADIIAYCNTRRKPVPQILERDISIDLRASLVRRLGI
jgi:hypothetical protein